MEWTRWDLWVQGRLRTRIALVDGGEEALAELSRRRSGAGEAEDRHGRTWTSTATDEGVVLARDGVAWVTAEGSRLRVGGHTLGWAPSPHGQRALDLTSDDGDRLLRATPGHDRGPWATVSFAPDLPEPVPVVLAVCFSLLHAERDGRFSFLGALADFPVP